MTAGETDPAYNWLIDELSLWDMAETKPSAIANVKTNRDNFCVYPNPLSGIFTIRSENGNNAGYKIYDLLGNIVSQGQIVNSTIVDLADMNKGMYYITVLYGAKAENYRLILK